MVTVNTPENKKIVDDYDFIFDSGMVMPVTIDPDAGDSVSFNADGVVITLVAKPNPNDVSKILPAEDITMFSRHLACVQHRRREIIQLTPEQQLEWRKALQEMGGTIQ